MSLWSLDGEIIGEVIDDRPNTVSEISEPFNESAPFLISLKVNSQPKLPDRSIKRREVGSNSQDVPDDDEVTGNREFEYGDNSLNYCSEL